MRRRCININDMENPTKYQRLFTYMAESHGVTLMESDMQEIERIILNDQQLPVESFDVDGWLGLTYGVWYHPFITLYGTEKETGIELSQLIADFTNDFLTHSSD